MNRLERLASEFRDILKCPLEILEREMLQAENRAEAIRKIIQWREEMGGEAKARAETTREVTHGEST